MVGAGVAAHHIAGTAAGLVDMGCFAAVAAAAAAADMDCFAADMG